MKFQDKLQILRKEKVMTQEKLAEKIGISRQAVAKWESGQSNPDFDKTISLSNLFGISIDKLIKDYDDENCSYEFTKQLDYINEKEIYFLCRAKNPLMQEKERKLFLPDLIHMIYNMKKII